jgi:hypothetical protein
MIRFAARCRVALATAALVAGAAVAAPQPAPRETAGLPAAPRHFLQSVGGFAAIDLARLDRGESIASTLDTDKREVAVVGAVLVHAPVERLIDRSRDVRNLRNSDSVLQVGTISATPRPADFDALTLEDYDLETIRACRPGDCGVRLPASSMARFEQDVNWRAPDWRHQAGTLWRRVLADYTAGYLANGRSALAEYRNKEVPLSVAQEFDVLFNQSRVFEPSAPGFFRHLRDFPSVPLEGAENVFYWSKADFGVRPVLAVTHLSLYRVPLVSATERTSAVIATKQIYATHYFDAALGLTLAFDDGAGGFYMVCVNRARTGSLAGIMRSIVRSTVQRRSREALENILRSTKTALEQPAG